MVQKSYTEDSPCLKHLVGDGDILRAGFQDAGRVIMGQDDGIGTVGNDIGKYFPRMDLG